MPGPVSDSYDPEFGTSDNARRVREAIRAVVEVIEPKLGERKDILEVIAGGEGGRWVTSLSERERRIIRFGLERAMEDL